MGIFFGGNNLIYYKDYGFLFRIRSVCECSFVQELYLIFRVFELELVGDVVESVFGRGKSVGKGQEVGLGF